MKIAKRIAKEYTEEEGVSKKQEESDESSSKEVPTYKTGIAGFDVLLGGGGIPCSTSVLVEGGPGSGKTI
ncbi:hypothetical protein HOG16_04200, partial [Candidatus Woesearchaeota archaeon]|nr:hypothetical protein [Candidatus Woesearchaeota archaeon]